MLKKVFLIFLCVMGFFFYGQKIRKHFLEDEKVELHNQLVLEMQECLDAKQWKCAEKNVRELLQENPQDENLQLHLAGILFEQERYRVCQKYIQTLHFKHSDLDFLMEKSAQLMREMENLGIENSGHFRLEFEGNPSREDVMEALSVLEVAYDSLGGLFHFYPEDKLTIVLYKSTEYQGIDPRPNWVGAVFDGELRIPVGMMQVRTVYRPVLFHELTHAFVRAMTRAAVPLWMNEGIAQIIDGSQTDKNRPAGNPPTLSELTESFLKQENRQKAEILYWYSEKMVQEMLKNSANPFLDFRDCLKDLKNFGLDQSLKKYFKTSAEELFETI